MAGSEHGQSLVGFGYESPESGYDRQITSLDHRNSRSHPPSNGNSPGLVQRLVSIVWICAPGKRPTLRPGSCGYKVSPLRRSDTRCLRVRQLDHRSSSFTSPPPRAFHQSQRGCFSVPRRHTAHQWPRESAPPDVTLCHRFLGCAQIRAEAGRLSNHTAHSACCIVYLRCHGSGSNDGLHLHPHKAVPGQAFVHLWF
jgi:hypothetical protein